MTTLRFVMYRFFQNVGNRLKSFRDETFGPKSVYATESSDSPVYQKHMTKQKTLDERKMEQLERQRAISAENAEVAAAKKRQLEAWKKEVNRKI